MTHTELVVLRASLRAWCLTLAVLIGTLVAVLHVIDAQVAPTPHNPDLPTATWTPSLP